MQKKFRGGKFALDARETLDFIGFREYICTGLPLVTKKIKKNFFVCFAYFVVCSSPSRIHETEALKMTLRFEQQV